MNLKFRKQLIALLLLFIININCFSCIAVKINNASETQNTEEYDLLILTPARFIVPLERLAIHKNIHDVKTKIVTLKEIYQNKYFKVDGRDDPEKIKYFIKNSIEEWNITYVLLVGGLKPVLFARPMDTPSSGSKFWYFPVRYCKLAYYSNVEPENYVTDLYYADIYDSEGNFSSWDTNNNGIFGEREAFTIVDEMDLKPDVYIGRLPCRNIFEVKTVVNKIIRYENSWSYHIDWFKRVVVIGGDTQPNNLPYYEGEIEGLKVLEYMKDFMKGFEAVKLFTSDGSLTSWKDTIKAFNRGCGFVYISGHGNPEGICTSTPQKINGSLNILLTRHINLLSNKNMLPICLISGCHVSKFDVSFLNMLNGFIEYKKDFFEYDSYRPYGGNSVDKTWVPECISWVLTRKKTGGSIATIGSTCFAYSQMDNYSASDACGWLYTHFFELYAKNYNDILGVLWGDTINDYVSKLTDSDEFLGGKSDIKNVQGFVLFGDPSLRIGGYGIFF